MNATTRVSLRAIRHAMDGAIDLAQRRSWFDDTKTTTTEEQPPSNAPSGGQQDVDTQDGKLLTHTQEQFNALMGERANRAKKTALNELLTQLGIEDVKSLETVVKAHSEAQEAQNAAAEAEKTELQKRDDKITAMQSAIDTANASTKSLQIQNAVMLTAPEHNVPSDRFNDLIQLMDMSLIEFDDNGNVKNDSVKSAIEKTLETRDYLTTVTTTEGDGKPKPGGNGSPVKRHKFDAAGKDGKSPVKEYGQGDFKM